MRVKLTVVSRLASGLSVSTIMRSIGLLAICLLAIGCSKTPPRTSVTAPGPAVEFGEQGQDLEEGRSRWWPRLVANIVTQELERKSPQTFAEARDVASIGDLNVGVLSPVAIRKRTAAQLKKPWYFVSSNGWVPVEFHDGSVRHFSILPPIPEWPDANALWIAEPRF